MAGESYGRDFMNLIKENQTSSTEEADKSFDRNEYEITNSEITKLNEKLDYIDGGGNDTKELIQKGMTTLNKMEKSIKNKISELDLSDQEFMNSFDGEVNVQSAQNAYEEVAKEFKELAQNPPYRDSDLIDIIKTKILAANEQVVDKIEQLVENKQKEKEILDQQA